MKITKLVEGLEMMADSWGNWGLKGSLLAIDTTAWVDNTAKVAFTFGKGGDTILQCRKVLSANSKQELVEKCKRWYKKNYRKALRRVLGVK